MPWDLSPRPLLPPPRPPYRWWLPLPYLALLTFALRWSSMLDLPDVIAAVAVAVGGWLLGLSAWRASGSRYTSWLGGIIYCFCCSTFAVFGWGATRELLANVCLLAAWLVAVAPREYGTWYDGESAVSAGRHWGAAGLLLGVGGVLHPFGLVSWGGAVVYIGRHYYRRFGQHKEPEWRRIAWIAVTVGTLLPLLAVAGYTWWTPAPVPALTVELHFGRWGAQLGYLGRYLLYFLPLLVLSFLSMFGNILTRATVHFVAVLTCQGLGLCLLILLFGGGRPQVLVLLHPVLALLCTEWTTATSIPPDSTRHGFSLFLVLAAGLGIGYYYFLPR